MAKLAGRKVNLFAAADASGTPIAGGREHSITINNEAIDVTDKDSDGWRTLLADPSVRSVDIGFSGFMDGATFVALGLETSPTALLTDYTVEIEGLGTLTGAFHLSSVELGTPHDDAVELTMSLASSGPIVWTAAT